MRNFHYTSINCKTSTKKILALSIELATGEELDELSKNVKLSRKIIDGDEVIILPDHDFRILIKNEYKRLEMI